MKYNSKWRMKFLDNMDNINITIGMTWVEKIITNSFIVCSLGSNLKIPNLEPPNL